MKTQLFTLLLLAGAVVSGCTTTGASVTSADPFANQDPFMANQKQPHHASSADVWSQPDALIGTPPANSSAPDPRVTAAQAPGWSSTRHVTHPEYRSRTVQQQSPVQTAVASDDPFMPATAEASSGVKTADFQAAKPVMEITPRSDEAPVFVDASTTPASASTPEWWSQ